MTEFSEVLEVIQETHEALKEFKKAHHDKYAALQNQLDEIQAANNRAGVFGAIHGSAQKPRNYGLTDTGELIPFFGKDEQMAKASSEGEGWLSGFVRNSLGINGRKNAVLESGAATVPVAVSMRIFDAMRAKNRLVQAGALTIPVDGPTNFVQITGDATISQHTEAANDIAESVPTFTPLQCDPGTLACLIPISLELAADSPNLDTALQIALGGAFATKLDSLGITALLADAGLNESATGESTETWGGTLTAVGSALAANMDVPTALISHPADWALRNGQRWDSVTTADGAWLGAPAVLKNMLDLPTTSMTQGKALFGNFAAGVAVVVRQELRLELVRWGKPGYGSHLLAAYARMQVYAMQPAALYRQLKTVA